VRTITLSRSPFCLFGRAGRTIPARMSAPPTVFQAVRVSHEENPGQVGASDRFPRRQNATVLAENQRRASCRKMADHLRG
jgi:hypothetical protein